MTRPIAGALPRLAWFILLLAACAPAEDLVITEAQRGRGDARLQQLGRVAEAQYEADAAVREYPRGVLVRVRKDLS